MKKVKTMGIGLFGFALAALITVNVQLGPIESTLSNGEPMVIVKKPVKKEATCPAADDVCMSYYIPGQGWLPVQGKPMTVIAPPAT